MRTTFTEHEVQKLHNVRRALESARLKASRLEHSEVVDTCQHCLDELAAVGIIRERGEGYMGGFSP